MYSFKDPRIFEAAAVPPVPDIKQWLDEFQLRPNANRRVIDNDDNKRNDLVVDKQLRIEHGSIKLEFETLENAHEILSKKYEILKVHYNKLSNEHDELQKLYDSQSSEIKQLKETIQQLESRQKHDETIKTLNNNVNGLKLNSKENTNTINNIIDWNFDCISNELFKKNTSDTVPEMTQTESSKKPWFTGADISTFTNSANTGKEQFTLASLNTAHSEKYQFGFNTVANPVATTDANVTNNIITATDDRSRVRTTYFTDIFDRELPSKLEAIRGDLLTYQPSETIVACFKMLKKAGTDDWQLRQFLMELIGGLVEENQDIDGRLVFNARDILKTQLLDLRSTIVKTSCELMIAFSACLGIKFGQVLAYLLPHCLSRLCVTIAVIRESHEQCLRRCIEYSPSLKCMKPLMAAVKDKHRQVRLMIIQSISNLVVYYTKTDVSKIEKFADDIAYAITQCITDSNSSIRNAVKDLFDAYSDAFPLKSGQLFNSLDTSKQRSLKKSAPKQVHTRYKAKTSNYPPTKRNLR
jgi:hypothetical protein